MSGSQRTRLPCRLRQLEPCIVEVLCSSGSEFPYLACGREEKSNMTLSFRIGNTNYDFYLVFGRFPAELGPETLAIGSGSKNNAERNQN